MRGIHTYTVGQSRGKGRIWLETLSLLDAEFVPGTPVSIEYAEDMVIRRVDDAAATQHVSSRKRAGREIPILDVSNQVDRYFHVRQKVRVEIDKGQIRIMNMKSFAIIEDNLPRLVGDTEKFRIVELPSGAGLAGFAFENTGLYDVIAAGDIEHKALEALRYNQPAPLLYYGNMFDIHQQDIPDADVFLFTVDCVSYSRLGRRDYVCSNTAPMVHHGLRIISAKRFPIVLIENVPEFGKSLWYSTYKRLMEKMGYNIADKILQARDFGTIASRPRFISIATQQPYTFEWPVPDLNTAHRDKVRKFIRHGEDRKWLSITENKTLRFFFGKHKNDQEERGNGFGITEKSIVSLNDTSMPAFISSYHKIQATGPFLQHPKNPDLLSLFEPQEILNIQGLQEYQLPPWQSLSTQYQLIGQSICGRMFRALALGIASTLMEMRLTKHPMGLQSEKSVKMEEISSQLTLDLQVG